MSNSGASINIEGQIWINAGERRFGGHGRMRLLSHIAETGSISGAARAMKMSYKAAWDAVDQMNNLAGEPLVVRNVGGKGGGSSVVTPRGQQLMANFSHLEREHQRFISELSQQANNMADDLLMLRRLNMKSSARNNFSGTVTAIKQGVVNDEIELSIAPNQYLVATITHESTENLALAVGSEVFALIKASSVIIVTDTDGVRFSARNRLSGKVERLVPGAVNTEVVLALESGGHLAAIVTNQSAESLTLEEGTTASAIFKASSIILGVNG